jgi:acyl carrier protein phosphodiesterase
MNHLAHLFLGGTDPEVLMGNLSGDFVKGPLEGRYARKVEAGIRMHRAIDAFTDSHPAAGAFRRHIAVEWRHYARVIADILFDYFLASGWSRYSDQTLDAFLQSSFRRIDGVAEGMPEGLRRIYPRMRDGRWFKSYAEIDGIRAALFHTSKRMSRRPPLEEAVSFLQNDADILRRHFEEFFPAVIEFARVTEASCHPERSEGSHQN